VPNSGNETAYPIIRVWGAITDPEIINITTGKRFKFTTTVPAGNYLEIDTLMHTVFLNGDLLYSKYGTMDNAISNWWGLAPGDNLIGLVAGAYTGDGIRADFYYRDAWI
jgi:phage-related protein